MVLGHAMLEGRKGTQLGRGQREESIVTHRTTELCSTMRALSDEAKDSGVATGLSLELAALLSGHGGWRIRKAEEVAGRWFTARKKGVS